MYIYGDKSQQFEKFIAVHLYITEFMEIFMCTKLAISNYNRGQIDI